MYSPRRRFQSHFISNPRPHPLPFPSVDLWTKHILCRNCIYRACCVEIETAHSHFLLHMQIRRSLLAIVQSTGQKGMQFAYRISKVWWNNFRKVGQLGNLLPTSYIPVGKFPAVLEFEANYINFIFLNIVISNMLLCHILCCPTILSSFSQSQYN
jgi:hypothetical protein